MDRFFNLGGTRDDQCAVQLYRLVSQLPEPHRATLRYLLAHVCRLCQWQHARGRNEPPTLVVQVFAHIILRPPWERIMYVFIFSFSLFSSETRTLCNVK